MVMVATKNLHIKKGSTKTLLARFMGPFRITKVVKNVAMRVDLPKGLRMHNVFHVSLLNKYDQGKQSKMPPMPECIDSELEFEIEKNHVARFNNRRLHKAIFVSDKVESLLL
jgi:hypothetical protein